MASSNMLAKDDGSIQQALTALDNHVATMRQSISTADSINASIAAAYIADSSTAFQKQVEDWINTAQQVMQMFQTLEQDLQGASNQINSADEQALHMSSFTSGSSGGVTNILMGQ